MHVDKTFSRDANGVAFPYTTISTGLKNASAVVKASPGVLVDVLVYTDGSSNGTAIIYDDIDSANGTELAKIVVKGADLFGGEVSILTTATAGMYLSLSGTGATAIVRYA